MTPKTPPPYSVSRRQRGMTLVELMVVIVVSSAMIAIAVPNLAEWMNDQELRGAARGLGDSFAIARAEAIRTGQDHIVFVASGAGVDPSPLGQDANGNFLRDPANNFVPILVLNDGDPGSANNNCAVDAGEGTRTVPAVNGVNWGVTNITAVAPDDGAAAIPANGVTFTAPDGTPTTWVLFRPDGIPVGFSAACAQGEAGSGGGSVYLTNGDKDLAVTLSPLGAVRVHHAVAGGWTQ